MSFLAQGMSQRLRKLTSSHHVPSVHLMFYWQQSYTRTILMVLLVMMDRIFCKGVVWALEISYSSCTLKFTVSHPHKDYDLLKSEKNYVHMTG